MFMYKFMRLSYCICLLLLLGLANSALGQTTTSNPIFVNSIDKKGAPASDVLTISGGGFGNSVSDIRVFFGSAGATPSSVRPGLIEVVIPAGATFDNVTVIDTRRGLSASSSKFFNLAFSPDAASIQPSGGIFNHMTKISPMRTVGTEMEGTPYYSVATCDLDGDGDLDLLGAATTDEGANIGIGGIPVYVNTSTTISATPTFETASPIMIPTGFPARYVACADLDNDGVLDVVATQDFQGGTTGRNRVYYAKNTLTGGNISFASPPELVIPINDDGDIRVVGRIAVKDLDNDGKADIIAINQDDNRVFVFRNTSTGTGLSFATPPIEIQGTNNPDDLTWGLDVKDLNRDGLPEIIVGKHNGCCFCA